MAVAQAAAVNTETIRQRYYAAGGRPRPKGRQPIAEAKRADIIAAIERGDPPKVVAANHGVGLSSVFRIFRNSHRGHCSDYRVSRKVNQPDDGIKNLGGRPPLCARKRAGIVSAIKAGGKTKDVAARFGVSRVTVFRIVRDAAEGIAA